MQLFHSLIVRCIRLRHGQERMMLTNKYLQSLIQHKIVAEVEEHHIISLTTSQS